MTLERLIIVYTLTDHHTNIATNHVSKTMVIFLMWCRVAHLNVHNYHHLQVTTGYSATLVSIYQITEQHIPEYHDLANRSCKKDTNFSISGTSTLTEFCHKCLLPNCILSFPTKILYAFLTSPIRTRCTEDLTICRSITTKLVALTCVLTVPLFVQKKLYNDLSRPPEKDKPPCIFKYNYSAF